MKLILYIVWTYAAWGILLYALDSYGKDDEWKGEINE